MSRKLISIKQKRDDRSICKNRFLSRQRYRIHGGNQNIYYDEYLTLLKIAWDIKFSLEKSKRIFGLDCATIPIYQNILDKNDIEINELLKVANEYWAEVIAD